MQDEAVKLDQRSPEQSIMDARYQDWLAHRRTQNLRLVKRMRWFSVVMAPVLLFIAWLWFRA